MVDSISSSTAAQQLPAGKPGRGAPTRPETPGSAHRAQPFTGQPKPGQGTPSRPDNHGAAVKAQPFVSDSVQISYSNETPATYSNTLSLENRLNDGFDLLRGLILNIFKEQGIDYKIAIGEETVDLSEITQEEAQELVADDGYFGVEQTADRIFSLAAGIAGGDPSRVEAVREGVRQGFEEALEAFGGWLPEISYQTLDAVMAKLDEWAGDNDPETQKQV